uniref:Uncharacterized protein n=1 Tax=Acrobeloides nanus TaxID=290746 RepID=A0A914DRT0_9BILA
MDDSDYKKELKRLEDRKKSAEQKCNYKELSDVLVELGEVHRMN